MSAKDLFPTVLRPCPVADQIIRLFTDPATFTSSYPIDLEDVAIWLERPKANVLRSLRSNRACSKEGVDYVVNNDSKASSRRTGRPRTHIYLSIDCAKRLLLAADCIKGDRIRLYFVYAEKLIHRLKPHIRASDHEDLIEMYHCDVAAIDANHEEAGKRPEAYYQQFLEQRLGATHVRTIHGITDITTATEHVEIKTWDQYKDALGQLLAYNATDFRPKLSVYLYGDCHYDEVRRLHIIDLFHKYHICVYELVGEDDTICKLSTE